MHLKILLDQRSLCSHSQGDSRKDIILNITKPAQADMNRLPEGPISHHEIFHLWTYTASLDETQVL